MSAKSLELFVPAARPAPEFDGLESVNRYCSKLSDEFYAMAIDLEMAEEIARRLMEQMPSGVRGTISRSRARMVARHLRRAADDCYDSAAQLDKVMPALRKAITRRVNRGHKVPGRWTV